MNPNSNQRCGCSCRPQIPTPPCINTDCHCNPCSSLPPSPPPKPPARPRQHNCGNSQQAGTIMPPVSQTSQSANAAAPPVIHPSLQPGQPTNMTASLAMQPVYHPNQPADATVTSAMQTASQTNQQPNTATSSMQPQTSGTTAKGCGCQTGNSLTSNGGICQMTIGMGYVPWQKWSHTYPMEQGFIRGTIFPELDFPFLMGRCH